ncbi:MAG TPA: NADH-quinone oxidoreductase subunit NuoG, partial [Buchnera sp. (in: enterobacteria)]|nr:NADH-quinone oxidoreductase subunit NuoG [Buchnera sp. (in: enterobacteria)]
VDGKKYNVDASNNLLHSCLSVGLDIPYFCWHPILGSIGSCRQCAVKKYDNCQSIDGNIVMSCMTASSDGTIISIKDDESQAFRKNIIELFMNNHPHDCPVCEEGGNCHLQDMTVMVGHQLRRYNFTKRIHKNQYLGPFISHEMNRCIGCYRCVRFYKDYADGTDLGVYGIANNIYFGRLTDGILENEHSGNLVEICPTGVFTDKTYSEHFHRKWDMQYAPSICNYCSIGCNISAGERSGEICRIENRYHNSINHYLICDLGRFGYGYSNVLDRPNQSFYRKNNNIVFLNDAQAVEKAVYLLKNAKKILGIGSNRASIESNFALKKIVGNENFSTGLLSDEHNCIQLIINILKNGGIYTPTLREIETYDTVLVIGEDISQVAPRLALSIRQAMKKKFFKEEDYNSIPNWHSQAILNITQNIKNHLFITSIDKTGLDDISTWNYCASIEDQTSFAFCLAHAIDNNSPNIMHINRDIKNNIQDIKNILLSSKKVLIVSGSHTSSVNLIQASFNIALALKNINIHVGLTLLTSNSNSLGVGLMQGMSLDVALDQVVNNKYDAMIVMENDLYRYFIKKQLDMILKNITTMIVIDYQNNRSVKQGTLVLSAANFFESSGTIINYESRAQRFFKVYDPKFYNNKEGKLESWKWLYTINSKINNFDIVWNNIDDIIDNIIIDIPDFKNIKNVAPRSSFRIFGEKIARSPHRYSGRTALRANVSVHEPKQPQDKDSFFSFSMEGNQQSYKFSSYIPFAWSPGWNSPQAWNKFQNTINHSLLKGDSGIRIFSQKKRANMSWFQFVPTIFKCSNDYRIVPY